MSLASLATFVLISAAQVATPGPSTVFLLNNAIRFGPRRAITALSGDLAAIIILASLSAAGVGALLAANSVLFTVLRLGGAVYLLWLGIRCFRAPPPAVGSSENPARTEEGRGLGLWLQSFGIGISNPKAILFFAALFPQFIPADGDHGLLAALVLMFALTKLVVLGSFALAARQLRTLFAGRGGGAVGRQLTGAVFILFGCGMMWSAVA